MANAISRFKRDHPRISWLVGQPVALVGRKLLAPLWKSPGVQWAVAVMTSGIATFWLWYTAIPLGPRILYAISGGMLLVIGASAAFRVKREDVEEWIKWEGDLLPTRNQADIFWKWLRKYAADPIPGDLEEKL